MNKKIKIETWKTFEFNQYYEDYLFLIYFLLIFKDLYSFNMVPPSRIIQSFQASHHAFWVFDISRFLQDELSLTIKY